MGLASRCVTRRLVELVEERNGKQSPIRIDAVALSKSPVNLMLDDEVPHIFTRKPRLRPVGFLIIGAKRLLQHGVIPGSSQTKARESAVQEGGSSSPPWDIGETRAEGKAR